MSRIVFTLLALIGALFQIFVTKTPPEEAFLFNFIVFNIGFWGIFAFTTQYIRSDVAWQQKGLFQKMALFLNLFRGILGILCIWFGGIFWSVTVIISAVFIFVYGCYELKHMEELEKFKNKPYYHTDFVISFDLFFPLALIGLLVAHRIGM